MDTKTLAEFDRGMANAICLKEDIFLCCRTLHLIAQRIERGDANSLEQLANHYQQVIDVHAELGTKLKQFGVYSGAVLVVPVEMGGGNGKATVVKKDNERH